MIHGCIDGFSRRILHLLCADNIRSVTAGTWHWCKSVSKPHVALGEFLLFLSFTNTTCQYGGSNLPSSRTCSRESRIPNDAIHAGQFQCYFSWSATTPHSWHKTWPTFLSKSRFMSTMARRVDTAISFLLSSNAASWNPESELLSYISVSINRLSMEESASFHVTSTIAPCFFVNPLTNRTVGIIEWKSGSCSV